MGEIISFVQNILGEIFAGKNIIFELIGYLGTAVLLFSFVMTKIKWMRTVNIIGCVLSVIYAICVNNTPTLVLNIAICIINSIQLIRLLIVEKRSSECMSTPEEAYNEEKKEDNI